MPGYQHPSKVHPGTIRPIFDHPVFCWLPSKVRRFLWCGVRHDEDWKESDNTYFHGGDSLTTQLDMRNLGSYVYRGESPALYQRKVQENQPSPQSFKGGHNARANDISGAKVNYTFQSDEASTVF